jgi:hypothetical protein
MLNTKDMSVGSGKTKPVISAGNHVVRINSVSFDQTPYDAEAYNILLNVETQPVSGEFEGFLLNVNEPNGPRYQGQVGRVRFSPYPYKDATLPSGREISRDNEVMKGMVYLSEVLGKRDELDKVQANTIEEFMTSCNDLFSPSGWFNMCVGGKEWENKEGYTNQDLFLPRMSKDGIPMEALDTENSRLLTFDKDNHIIPLKKKNSAPTATDFEPVNQNGSASDFDL